MNESRLSYNLQLLMRTHGNLSVSELARLTAIPQPTIHHIISGSTKNPRKKALQTLAQFFSISVEQLLGLTSLPNLIPETIKKDLRLKSIPVIEWDMLYDWPHRKIENNIQREIIFDKEIADNSFALKIDDTKIEPLFPQNSLLIFNLGKCPKDRDFVIAKQNNQILFNRLFIENNENYIKQNLEDGSFKFIKLDKNTDSILATLIEVRIQY
ncbi:helix-turn-helix domain-containing protein [Legionella hackeliae]|uniref:Peptidase [Helix-turn-helix type domain] n=1 Tax=Legionella hackeliae TaxID=449 RepID=A0A0A8UQA5_LEGHA|nr:helix-turn-helix domain-containing protein [Legionella hackeliae]KTD13427.1 HTH-type transcriptional regulator [Legionella hackeliae]CEK09267.1 Peptidase [Helix-turn-helix type domain] [Legionella hackeliae]STX49174.1 HTH-type transcriptional regulator [Legionella hackeliae]